MAFPWGGVARLTQRRRGVGGGRKIQRGRSSSYRRERRERVNEFTVVPARFHQERERENRFFLLLSFERGERERDCVCVCCELACVANVRYGSSETERLARKAPAAARVREGERESAMRLRGAL